MEAWAWSSAWQGFFAPYSDDTRRLLDWVQKELVGVVGGGGVVTADASLLFSAVALVPFKFSTGFS